MPFVTPTRTQLGGLVLAVFVVVKTGAWVSNAEIEALFVTISACKKLKLVLAFPQAVDDRSPTMLDALFEAV